MAARVKSVVPTLSVKDADRMGHPKVLAVASVVQFGAASPTIDVSGRRAGDIVLALGDQMTTRQVEVHQRVVAGDTEHFAQESLLRRRVLGLASHTNEAYSP